MHTWVLHAFCKFAFLNQKLVTIKRHDSDFHHSEGNTFPYEVVVGLFLLFHQLGASATFDLNNLHVAVNHRILCNVIMFLRFVSHPAIKETCVFPYSPLASFLPQFQQQTVWGAVVPRQNSHNHRIPAEQLSVCVEAVDIEVFSEMIVAEQLLVPSLKALLIVVAAEHHVIPLLFLNEFGGEGVADEASRQVLTDHTFQNIQLKRLQPILQTYTSKKRQRRHSLMRARCRSCMHACGSPLRYPKNLGAHGVRGEGEPTSGCPVITKIER